MNPDNLGLKGCILQSTTERDSANISLEPSGRISALGFRRRISWLSLQRHWSKLRGPQTEEPHGDRPSRRISASVGKHSSSAIQSHFQTRPSPTMLWRRIPSTGLGSLGLRPLLRRECTRWFAPFQRSGASAASGEPAACPDLQQPVRHQQGCCELSAGAGGSWQVSVEARSQQASR